MLNQLPTWEKLAKQIIWQQIGKLKGKTILDFGSGTGITADHFAADNKVIAIEPSEDLLAQQVITNSYRQIVGSIDELKNLPSNSFDYIFCHNVLEYADDREIIVGEFYRLMKKNGKLSIVKHNRNGRVMQMVVLLNNFDEAKISSTVKTATLNSSAQSITMMTAIFQIGAAGLFCSNFMACVPFGIYSIIKRSKKMRNGRKR